MVSDGDERETLHAYAGKKRNVLQEVIQRKVQLFGHLQNETE